MPLGFAFPILYMCFITDASWWVNPTIIFTAMDVAFLGAGIIGGFLPSKEGKICRSCLARKQLEAKW